VSEQPTQQHPIRLVVNDDLERSRLTVFFRLLLAIPHLIWLALWGIVVHVAVLIAWFATLFTGRCPDGLHDFIARYLRYLTHVSAYLFLIANPYPTFGGRTDYAIDLEVDPPEPQNRLVTFFRIILAIPALIVAGVLRQVLAIIALLGWFTCLAIGRMPKGMRDLSAYCLRYELQTYGYLYLLTARYPSFAGTPVA
jgi:Domain of unknown function (DUF4389)